MPKDLEAEEFHADEMYDTTAPPQSVTELDIAEGLAFFLEAFSSKRFANRVQADAAEVLVTALGLTKFKELTTWAATIGMSRGRALVAMQGYLRKPRRSDVDRLLRRDEAARSEYGKWEEL